MDVLDMLASHIINHSWSILLYYIHMSMVRAEYDVHTLISFSVVGRFMLPIYFVQHQENLL